MWAQMRWGWSDRLFLIYIIFIIIIIAGNVGKQWQMRWSNLYLFSIDLCLCGKALPKGWTLIKTTHPSKSNVEIKDKWENSIKKLFDKWAGSYGKVKKFVIYFLCRPIDSMVGPSKVNCNERWQFSPGYSLGHSHMIRKCQTLKIHKGQGVCQRSQWAFCSEMTAHAFSVTSLLCNKNLLNIATENFTIQTF